MEKALPSGVQEERNHSHWARTMHYRGSTWVPILRPLAARELRLMKDASISKCKVSWLLGSVLDVTTNSLVFEKPETLLWTSSWQQPRNLSTSIHYKPRTLLISVYLTFPLGCLHPTLPLPCPTLLPPKSKKKKLSGWFSLSIALFFLINNCRDKKNAFTDESKGMHKNVHSLPLQNSPELGTIQMTINSGVDKYNVI